MEPLGQLADPDPSPPPPPAGGQAPPDRIVGGVAGLIADRLGVDALWARIGFVVLALAGGIGVIVYAGCWMALVAGAWSRPLRFLGGALLVAGVPILVSARGHNRFITGPLAVALLLVGLALALWQPRRTGAASGAPSSHWGPPPFDPNGSVRDATATGMDGQPGATSLGRDASSGMAGLGREASGGTYGRGWGGASGVDRSATTGWGQAGSEDHGAAVDGTELGVAGWRGPRVRRWQRQRRPRRERSVLGRVTLGAAAIIGAGWALADQLDGGRLHPEQWLGAAAAVCGIGMLVGAFAGRARWLIVPAVALAGTGYVAGTTARMGIPAGDLFGDRYVSVGPYTSGDVSERVGIGSINVWVDGGSDQPFGSTPVHVDVRAGIGNITISIPDGVTVEVRARADHGNVRAAQLGRSGDGTTVFGDGAPAVVVDAWVGRGDIDIVEYWMSPLTPTETTLPFGVVPSAEQPTSGTLVQVRPGVAMTTDGWVVLGEGAALISPDGEVTATGGGFTGGDPSSGYPGDGIVYPAPDGGAFIDTGWGQFRLLPRDLLLTPEQEVIDLRAIRAEVAASAATATPAGGAAAAPSTTFSPVDGATTLPGPDAGSSTTTVPQPPAGTVPSITFSTVDDSLAVTTPPSTDTAGG